MIWPISARRSAEPRAGILPHDGAASLGHMLENGKKPGARTPNEARPGRGEEGRRGEGRKGGGVSDAIRQALA